MKEITLTQGKTALIDDMDFGLVSAYKWHYSKSSKNYGRAKSNLGKRGKSVMMHRFIMNAPIGLEVDHINGNPLDNRRSNLRLVTHEENQANMSLSVRNKVGYKGVSWHKKAKKWQAHIMVKGNKMYLGLFLTAKDAAKAYNMASIRYKRYFTRINTIKD
jgi:hypothetical protein